MALLRCNEAQVSLTVALSSSAFYGLLFLIFLLTILHRFSMFRSGEFAGQSSTPTPCSFNHLLVLLAVWTAAKSCWKMKSASLKSCYKTCKTCSHLKRGLWTTGQQSSSSSLSPGKTPLKTSVAKFLDTSVCGALDALTPASVHSL